MMCLATVLVFGRGFMLWAKISKYVFAMTKF